MKRACQGCGAAQAFAFCSNCVPPKDSVVVFPTTAIFVGNVNILRAAFYRMTGKKVIRWWLGSDVLCLILCPPGRGMLSIFLHRLSVVVSEPLFNEHWVDSQDLKDELESIALIDENKTILVEPHVGKNLKVFEKKKHDGINIAYYHPRTDTRYQRWLYGVDIVEKLRTRYSELNWIRLDGTADMSKIFPTLDIYIRPNRHDGRSRLKEECRLNQIPVIWTNQLNPNFGELCESLDRLLYQKKFYPVKNSRSLYNPNRPKFLSQPSRAK